MIAVPRWGVWDYNPEGKKVPRFRVNHPEEWTTYEAASSVKADGVGFLLGDGWSGLDLDDCVRDGVIDYRAQQNILNMTKAYREISPSKTGIKIFGRSQHEPLELTFKDKVVPSYGGRNRYYCVTGEGSGDPTVDITPFLEVIEVMYFKNVFGKSNGAHEPFVLPDVINENRNTTLFQLGRRHRELGASRDEIWSILVEANEKRCKEPLDLRELNQILNSACRYNRGTGPLTWSALEREMGPYE
jgi:hypothetical protein